MSDSPVPIFEDDRPDLINQLGRTAAAANRLVLHFVMDAGLTGIQPSHADVLFRLMLSGSSLSMTELARSIGRDPSTVTALIKKLKAAGFVETVKHKGDGRMTNVRLTARGEELKSVFGRIRLRLLSVMEDTLSEEQLSLAYELLLLLEERFRKAVQPNINGM